MGQKELVTMYTEIWGKSLGAEVNNLCKNSAGRAHRPVLDTEQKPMWLGQREQGREI